MQNLIIFSFEKGGIIIGILSIILRENINSSIRFVLAIINLKIITRYLISLFYF